MLGKTLFFFSCVLFVEQPLGLAHHGVVCALSSDLSKPVKIRGEETAEVKVRKES